ncbi:MAG: tetratricopeptide repeat protein [Alphaproteobacteria bacterium]|nr:tetratricopeptide repeat protein [Alphaproteobacteria bacterium]
MRKILSAFALTALLAAGTPQAQAGEILFRQDAGLTNAEYYLANGKYSAAILAADGVLQRHPGSADAYTYRGYALDRLGQTDAAEKDFKSALAADPSHLGANAYLAEVYLQKGEVARAIEQMQVIRMTCGRTVCAELTAVESEIDRYKSGQKPAPPPQKK